MRLRQLECLVAVAGGLTAVDRCHVSQLAVSPWSLEPESALRTRLFIRDPGCGAVLTEAGRQVVGEARAVPKTVSELGPRWLGHDAAGAMSVSGNLVERCGKQAA